MMKYKLHIGNGSSAAKATPDGSTAENVYLPEMIAVFEG
jgi:hypothetical protein